MKVARSPSRRPPRVRATAVAGPRILGTALALLAFLIPIRGRVIGFVPGNFTGWRAYVELLAGATYDGMLVVTAVVVALTATLVGGPRWGSATAWAFNAFAVVALGAAVANVEVVAKLERPLSFQWLYYSEFLGSVDARQALAASVSPALLGGLVSSAAALLAIGFLAGRLGARAWGRAAPRTRPFVGYAVAALIVAWLTGGHAFVTRHRWPIAKLANPLYALGRSALSASAVPPLFSLATRFGPEEFEVATAPVFPPSDIAPVRSTGSFRTRVTFTKRTCTSRSF